MNLINSFFFFFLIPVYSKEYNLYIHPNVKPTITFPKLILVGEEKDERERERYMVVRAGQAGTALQPVDINNR